MIPQKIKSECAFDSWNGGRMSSISAIWKAHLIRGSSYIWRYTIIGSELVGIYIFPAFMATEEYMKKKIQ